MQENQDMNALMKTNFRFILLFLSIGLTSLMSCDQNSDEYATIKGIYGSPKPFWDKELHLNDLGVNAVFIHSGSINQEIMDRAGAEGLKVFAEFATLNGKNYVEEHPEAWAVNEKGEKVEAATWFMGVI